LGSAWEARAGIFRPRARVVGACSLDRQRHRTPDRRNRSGDKTVIISSWSGRAGERIRERRLKGFSPHTTNVYRMRCARRPWRDPRNFFPAKIVAGGGENAEGWGLNWLHYRSRKIGGLFYGLSNSKM